MYVFLGLFIVSFVAVFWMLGRKLALVKNGEITLSPGQENVIPDLGRLRELTSAGARRYGYAALVVTLRLYVRTLNTLKSQYGSLKNKMRNLKNKSASEAETLEHEASRFLKMISDYKNKIRQIKERIHEEEKYK